MEKGTGKLNNVVGIIWVRVRVGNHLVCSGSWGEDGIKVIILKRREQAWLDSCGR